MGQIFTHNISTFSREVLECDGCRPAGGAMCASVCVYVTHAVLYKAEL